jgi:hypothetical protein
MQDHLAQGRPRRRFLVWCLSALLLGSSAALPSVRAKEKTMRNYLYFHELDPGLFPELERDPGVYAIELSTVKPKRDSRIPVPEDSPMALVVSYTLLASSLPPDAALKLEISGLRADGELHRFVFDLIEPAPARDNVLPIEPDPSIKLAPGTVYRSVFWIDLGPPLRDGTLKAGDALAVAYGPARGGLTAPAP